MADLAFELLLRLSPAWLSSLALVLFVCPTLPTLDDSEAGPARPSLGTLGPLMLLPGLASHLGLHIPPRSIPSVCSRCCLPTPLGSPHAPAQTSQDPGLVARLGSRLGSRPGPSLPSLPLPVCLSS